jgi:hypothetical protein
MLKPKFVVVPKSVRKPIATPGESIRTERRLPAFPALNNHGARPSCPIPLVRFEVVGQRARGLH